MRIPREWNTWNIDQQMAWLKSLTREPNSGRKPKLTKKRKKYKHLKEKDAPQVHILLSQLKNHSMVADTMGVSRKTLYRFLEKHPISDGFKIEDEVSDYEEIKVWMHRQKAFSKTATIRGYINSMKAFYKWMLAHYPDRARPRLWASDQILEWVQTFPKYIQHQKQVAIRQLGKKAPKLFPLIDLGLLPTRKTGKARRSLAGKEEYYLTLQEVRALLRAVDEIEEYSDLDKKCYKAIIALLFNTGCRTGNSRTGLGLCGIKVENLKLNAHNLKMKDKFDINWNILGLSDDTCNYLRTYLQARGNPTSGFLFTTNKRNGTGMHATIVNKMLKVAGAKAGITGKRLVCKTFRKSLVKHALEVLKMNPVSLIGTGKDPKTCFCVGWTSMGVLMAHYAPQLKEQIEQDRQKFTIKGEMD